MKGLRLTERGRRVLDAAALTGVAVVGAVGLWLLLALATALAGPGVSA